ncbi:MAG: type II secretion system F family protein, partial [Planctomycetota bacterium]
AMVRAGEKGGCVEPALERHSSYEQGQVELRNRVLSALIYPTAIVSIGLIILGVLFVFFVPKFADKYDGVDLQLPTVIVMGVSDALVNRWGTLLVLLALAAAGSVWALRQEHLRARFTELCARLPVVGPLLRALAVARFARILGTLLESGVPMLASLRIAKGAAGLPAMAHAIDAAADAVTQGDPLTEPLSRSGLLGEDVVEMIGVAESANNLGAVLPTIASTLEERVSRRLDIAVKLIEPVTILLIGCVIAFVALGLLLPMFKLASGQSIA